ncbi:MAG: SpoIID/LytB domain-containing protein [Ruminococcus sp.]|nr:SpoIID/LytB domain-containing protein [Ruminococcus sp.]
MKLRSILNGIAALAAIGSFYTFAFLMVDDVDTAQISSEYYYNTATQTAPAQTEQEREKTDAETDLSGASYGVPVIKAELSPKTAIEQAIEGSGGSPQTGEQIVYGAEAERNIPVQTEATYVPQQESDIEYTENVSPDAEQPQTDAANDNTDYSSFPEESADDMIFSENILSEAVVDDQNAYADADDRDPDLLSELDRQPSQDEIMKNLSDMQAAAETENTYTAPVTDYGYVSSYGTYFETVPYITDYTVPDSEPVTELTTVSPEGNEIFTARVGGKTAEYDAYELVCMIVSTEMSPSFGTEALKAQAVAAYSYVKYHNQKGLVPSVLTKSDVPDEVRAAVSSVWGKCCYYNGSVAQTVYTASTAGTTASAVNVWGGENVPYLTSISTAFDVQSDPNYGVITTFSEDYIRRSLENGLGITLSDNPYNWLTVTSRIDGNYVSGVSVDGQTTVSGRKIREQILNFGIKSWCFDVSYADGEFTFVTYGYGHGVGMSQNGANILAKQGSTYDQILMYYFPGIEIR